MIFTFCIISDNSFAQQSAILDNYIKEAFANNASLKTQQFDLEHSITVLEEAKTLFMPRVNFQFQYTLAAGGRRTELPVGDLLNPVYGTLNKLTSSNNFPNIDNQQINFLPNNFQDSKIHTVYPILNKEIYYNREIKKELITIEQAKINVFKRELVKNIKSAYVQWLLARQAVSIYKNALVLVTENVRVNEKLVKNDVGTNAQVLKAKSEVSKVESSIVEYENNVKNAAAYFNFLRNQPFSAEIQIDSTLALSNELSAMSNLNGKRVADSSLLTANREEFAQLKGGERALSLQKKMNESYKIPKIGVSLDLGFQGYGFKIWDKQAYGLLGLQLDLPLYTAKSNDLKILQNDIDLKKTQAQSAEILQQIRLQTQIAQTNLETAQEQFKVNDAELAYADEYYRLTDKRYAAGAALQIELVDARTQKTAAELKRSVAHFTVLQRLIELERAAASYLIEN